MAEALTVLKQAFNEGYIAFEKVEKNEHGWWNNPPNPYKSHTLVYKEWQRGFDRHFWEYQKKAEKEVKVK